MVGRRRFILGSSAAHAAILVLVSSQTQNQSQDPGPLA